MARDTTTDLAARLDVGQLSLAVEVIQDSVAVYDAHARIVIVNDRLLAATGYSRAELVGQPVLVLIPEALREQLIPRMTAYALAPVPRTLEAGLTTRIERKDGSTFEAQVANTPVHGVEGHLVVASIRNIRDVSLEEIKLRGMLEANPDATMICTPEGRMILSNAGASRLFEQEHVTLFNQPVASLFPSHHGPELRKQLQACHDAAVAGDQPSMAHTLDLEVVRKDASVVPVEVTISSLHTAQGLTLRVIVKDISERWRLAHEAEAMKDGFLATVSHELRTPLTSVLGYAELLEDLGQEDLSQHARLLLDVVIRNARRELRLVDDLLTMVQIGEGAFRIEPGRVNLAQLVQDAVEAAVPVARRARVMLSLVTSSEDTFVTGDADRLGQAVDNLLTNSLKFSPESGEVAVALTSDAETATVAVINQGVGIADADIEHVFDRLYRGDNAVVAEKQGVGLGLSIVRSIVEAHGGEVRAACTDATTRFEITLPRIAGVRAPAPVPPPRDGPRRNPGPVAG